MSIYNTNRERTAWIEHESCNKHHDSVKFGGRKRIAWQHETCNKAMRPKVRLIRYANGLHWRWPEYIDSIVMVTLHSQHTTNCAAQQKNDSYYDFVCFEGRLFSVVFCLTIWWRLETNLNLSWSPDRSFSHTESQHDKNYPKINKQMASMRGQTTLRIISHLTFLHKMMFKKELQPHTLSYVHIFTLFTEQLSRKKHRPSGLSD